MDKMNPEIFTPLTEAQDWVTKNRGEGCVCPCCGQIAKIYKRKLNNGMALELIALYKLSMAEQDTEYFHHTKFAKLTCGEISKLVYWGLTEEKPKSTEDNSIKTSGYWKITPNGKLFVENELSVQSHVYLYDAKLLGFSDERITIIESLGKKFSYSELMQS
jgi:hypothetical protein